MRPWAVSGVALTVLAACGLAWLPNPQHGSAQNAGTPSQWALASALPSSSDFPPDWHYSLRGSIAVRATASSPSPTSSPQKNPDETFVPAECGHSPMDQLGSLNATTDPLLTVDAIPPGQNHQGGHQMHFWIWVVADAPHLVAEYTNWLGHCRSYHYRYHDPGTGTTSDDAVTQAQVDVSAPDGVDVVAVSYGASKSADDIYYALRGVVLACLGVDGADRTLAQHLADQTVRRLVAL